MNNPKNKSIKKDPKTPPAKQAIINGILHFHVETQFDKNHMKITRPITPKYIKRSKGKNSILVG